MDNLKSVVSNLRRFLLKIVQHGALILIYNFILLLIINSILLSNFKTNLLLLDYTNSALNNSLGALALKFF